MYPCDGYHLKLWINKVKVYLDAIDIKRININGFLGKCGPLITSLALSLPPWFCLFAPLFFARYHCQCSTLLLLGL